MPSDSIHIAVAADGGYVVPLSVALHGLARHQPAGQRTHVHVLADRISVDARQQVEAAALNLTVAWIDLNDSLFAGLNLSSLPHITRATAARLFLPNLLPETLQRVLYLDLDLIVRADLTPLFRSEIDEAPVAAVRSPGLPWIGANGLRVPWRELGIPPSLPYFNAGVLLIDLRAWRETEIGTRALQLLKQYELPLMDQDALNLAVAGRWHELAPRWNMQIENHLGTKKRLAWVYEDPDLLDSAARDPAVVHFVGAKKPWTREGASRPFADEWLRIAQSLNLNLGAIGSRPAGPGRSRIRGGLQRLRRAGDILIHG